MFIGPPCIFFFALLLKGLRVFWMPFFEKNVLSSTRGLRSNVLLFVIPWKRMTWELRGFRLGIKWLFLSMFGDSFQRDHQFCWDGSSVFCLEVDLSGMSGLLQCPLGHERRFFSTKISVEESLSPVLVIKLLLIYG